MKKVIKSSDIDWLEAALKEYASKKEFTFIDDQKLGLTEHDLKSAVNLIKASKSKAGKTVKQITAVLVGIGLSAAGVWIIILSIADPEPTTKLGLLIAGGFVLAISGGYGTLRALGVHFTVVAKKGDMSFEIKPD
ncbi:MAG: hypothetical protein AB8B72_11770 [Crocinitomicaceae bacterium]